MKKAKAGEDDVKSKDVAQPTGAPPVVVAPVEPKPGNWSGAREVSIEDVVLNSWNPNQMSDATFSELVSEIEKEGFDVPVIVIPHPQEQGKWMVVDGEHRFKAMKVLGHKLIPIVVKPEWDQLKAKIETVRRNVLKGDLDRAKFTSLVKSISDDYKVDVGQIPRMMGFGDEAEFNRYFLKEKKRQESQTQEILEDTKKEVQIVDNVSFLLSEIFSQHGETLSQSFLFFMHKDRMHLMIQMSNDTYKRVDRLAKALKRNETDINEALGKALDLVLPELEKASAVDGTMAVDAPPTEPAEVDEDADE